MERIEGLVSEPLLEVSDFCVAYGKVEALNHLAITVRKGQISTVIGPNGAGKSTLLNALAGILPSKGLVRFKGQPLAGVSTESRVEQGLVLVPEKRDLFGAMSVEDNLLMGAFVHRRDRDYCQEKMREVFVRFPKLQQRKKQYAATLSGGERQMLAIGRALMSNPDLLLLDEPSLGLAPLVVRYIFEIIAELKASGVSILLIEQNARAALRVADFGYVLETGRIALEGDRTSLGDDPRIIETYLGASTV